MTKNKGARIIRKNDNLFARFMINIDFKERICQSANNGALDLLGRAFYVD